MAELESAINDAEDVVEAYGEVLERTGGHSSLLHFHSQADLPYPKEKIRECIEMLLVLPVHNDKRINALETSNIHLNTFIPDEEYRIVLRQRAAISQALKEHAGGEQTALQVLKTVVDACTQDEQALIDQMEERTHREDQITQERHRVMAAKRTRLLTGVK